MFRFFARRVNSAYIGRAPRAKPALLVKPQPENKVCPLRCASRYQVRAGGFQRGRLCARERPASAPLWLISLVTFLFSDKKVTLPHLQEFCTPKFFHSPCGMWKTFLWKNVTKKFLPQALWKSYSFQHLPCGEISVAALMQKGLFHINLYYHCYD